MSHDSCDDSSVTVEFSQGAAAGTHLTFGSDAYVTCDGRLGAQVDGLLDADVSQGVFSKDRTGVKVGSHKAAEARQSLMMEERTVVLSDGFLTGNRIHSILKLLRCKMTDRKESL